MIKVTRKSDFTGREGSMELPLTQEELDAGLARSWSHCRKTGQGNGTEHMQNIFPQLNPDQVEFLMTGSTPEEWAEMFPPEPEDD